MSINHLPPELLTIILANESISPKERLQLRTVSTHWCSTIEKNVLAKATKLLLDDSCTATDSLPYHPDIEYFRWLLRLYPAVTHLSIDVSFDRSVDSKLPKIIAAYRSTLLSLRLYYHRSNGSQLNQAIARAINSLSKLTHLEVEPALDLTNHTSSLLTYLAPTLARLEEFSYPLCDHKPKKIWNVITNRCARLKLHYTNMPIQDVPAHAAVIDLQIFGPTRSLQAYDAFVASIVTQFPSLQKLQMPPHYKESTITFNAATLRHLSSLESLSELRLEGVHYEKTQLNRLGTDRPLTRVRKLQLQLQSDIKDEEHFVAALVDWFPRLKDLAIEWPNQMQLTTTLLCHLARLGRLTELQLSGKCFLREELSKPPERQLTSLKRLDLRIESFISGKPPYPALVDWFPNLEQLTLECNSDLQSILLRNLSSLSHLLELQLLGLRYNRDRLYLPTSIEGKLSTVRKLHWETYFRPVNAFDSQHLCDALSSWFPNLEQLTLAFELFESTASMVHGLATMKRLTELSLSKLRYNMKDLSKHSSQAELTCVKVLDVKFDGLKGIAAGEHICSALVAWFPNLTKLTINDFDCEGNYETPNKFFLTRTMLRQLAQLEHLTLLQLPELHYRKKQFDAPEATDQPLASVRQLRLHIAEVTFDGEHFCSTLAAWFPQLKELIVYPYICWEEECRDAFKANWHHFGSSVSLAIWL